MSKALRTATGCFLALCLGCTSSGIEGEGLSGPKGDQGPPGPMGVQGPPGTFDRSAVIANGSTPQDAGFHITGNGVIGDRVGVQKTAPLAALDVAGGISAMQMGEVWRSGTLEPGESSEEFNLNMLWSIYGNVGVVTLFIGREGMSSDNSWAVAIDSHGQTYNQYDLIAAQVTAGFDVQGLTASSLASTVTFHNGTNAKTRYAINRLPLVVNHPSLLAP
ncbi:MAG: collagen-like protein [Myxococcaceae bacterium]|nr:collagen-like protein [Myxococcaceae bacterium]